MIRNARFCKILSALLVTLVLCCPIKSQNIDLLNDDLDFLLKYEKYYGLADSLAFFITSKNIANGKTYLLKSKLALLRNKNNTGIENIVKAIQMGVYFENEVMNNKFFKSKLRNDDFKFLDSINKESIKSNIMKFDPYEYESIMRLFNTDQAYRRFYNQFKDSIQLTSEKYNILESKITLQMLKKHIANYGFPKLNLYGEELANRLFTVFIHISASSEYWDDLLQILNNAFQNKYIDAKFYYYFYNSYLYEIKKTTMISGEYNFYQYQQVDIDNILNFDTIDNQRNQLGLCPLFYLIKKSGKDSYPGYKFDIDAQISKIRKSME